jgi:hypothetical protein
MMTVGRTSEYEHEQKRRAEAERTNERMSGGGLLVGRLANVRERRAETRASLLHSTSVKLSTFEPAKLAHALEDLFASIRQGTNIRKARDATTTAAPQDPQTALLDAIRNRPQLRPTNRARSSSTPSAPVVNDPQSELLNAVRNRVQLRPTNRDAAPSTTAPAPTPAPTLSGIQAAIQALGDAVAQRSVTLSHSAQRRFDLMKRMMRTTTTEYEVVKNREVRKSRERWENVGKSRENPIII